MQYDLCISINILMLTFPIKAKHLMLFNSFFFFVIYILMEITHLLDNNLQVYQHKFHFSELIIIEI